MKRDDFRAYAYAIWSRQIVADFMEFYTTWNPENRPEPAGEGDRFQRQRDVLQQILLRAISDEQLTSKADLAFSPGDEAIFISRSAREEITGLDHEEARQYFAPSKSLGDRFARGSAKREPIRVPDLLQPDQNFLREQLGVTTDEIPHYGQVVVKNAGGIAWIKLVRQHTPVSAEITEVALEVGAAVIVERLRSDVAPWWKCLNTAEQDVASLDDEVFTACCHDLLRSLREQHDGIPVPPTIDPAGLARDKDFSIIEVCAATVTTDGVLERLRPAFAAGAQPHRLLVILCTKSEEKTIDRAFSDILRRIAGTDVVVAVAGPRELQALLSHCPWVWSKYLGTRRGFHVAGTGTSARPLLVEGDDPASFFADRNRWYALVSNVERNLDSVAASLLRSDRRANERIEQFIGDYRKQLQDLGFDPNSLTYSSSLEPETLEARLQELAHDRQCATAGDWMRGFAAGFAHELWTKAVLPRLKDRLPIDTSIVHPALDSVSAKAGGLYRIHGSPGTGKSGLCYRLLRHELQDQPTIIVSPKIAATLTEADKGLVVDLLSHMVDAGDNRITIIIERLERELGQPAAQTLLHRILVVRDALHRTRPDIQVTLVVTHWPVDSHFNATYGSVFREWRFYDIDMDATDNARFNGELLTFATNALDIRLSDLAEDVDDIYRTRTPRQLIEALLWFADTEYEIPVWHDEDVSFWATAYEELVAGPDTARAALLLRILVTFAHLGLPLNVPNVRQHFCDRLGCPAAALDESLVFLHKRGWIRYSGPQRDIVLNPTRCDALMFEWRSTGVDVIDSLLTSSTTLQSSADVLERALWFAEHNQRLQLCRKLLILAPEKAEVWMDAATVCLDLAMADEVIGPLLEKRRAAHDP